MSLCFWVVNFFASELLSSLLTSCWVWCLWRFLCLQVYLLTGLPSSCNMQTNKDLTQTSKELWSIEENEPFILTVWLMQCTVLKCLDAGTSFERRSVWWLINEEQACLEYQCLLSINGCLLSINGWSIKSKHSLPGYLGPARSQRTGRVAPVNTIGARPAR